MDRRNNLRRGTYHIVLTKRIEGMSLALSLLFSFDRSIFYELTETNNNEPQLILSCSVTARSPPLDTDATGCLEYQNRRRLSFKSSLRRHYRIFLALFQKLQMKRLTMRRRKGCHELFKNLTACVLLPSLILNLTRFIGYINCVPTT